MKVVGTIHGHKENENKPPLPGSVQEAVTGASYDVTILAVDDNSPHGTADRVQDVRQRPGSVHLSVGEERRPGTPQVEGIPDDFVIGSCCLRGGKIPANWSCLRRIISRWVNFSVRFIAGQCYVHNHTSGLTANKADLPRQIDLPRNRPGGYIFLTSLPCQAVNHGGEISRGSGGIYG